MPLAMPARSIRSYRPPPPVSGCVLLFLLLLASLAQAGGRESAEHAGGRVAKQDWPSTSRASDASLLFVASMAGVFASLLVARRCVGGGGDGRLPSSKSHWSGACLRLLQQFGTGVLLGTALVHMIAPAINSLSKLSPSDDG